DRLVAALVQTQVYQLSSTYEGEEPAERHFARAMLRPLSPQQLAISLILASGPAKDYRTLEKEAAPMLKTQFLDGKGDRYEASAGEALYMSNHAEIQKLVAPQGTNLTARLAAISDGEQLVDTAVWS